MSAEQFLANVEGGIVPVSSHQDVLKVAFIYMNDVLWSGGYGVFEIVERLHAHGWSFGEGELRLNRTLDIFYLSQLAAAIYRHTSQLKDDTFPLPFSDFPALYSTHHALLHSSVWRSYYSATFLTQHITACFYRPPNLQDLPDSSLPLCRPHRSPISLQILRLPRWAHTVSYAYHMQSFLTFATLSSVALKTLEPIITNLYIAYPSVPPYSESHARFWLEYFAPKQSLSNETSRRSVGPNHFGLWVAQGLYDIHRLEANYLEQVSERDVTKKASELEEVLWCGWPDGGIAGEAWRRGWQHEIGSEEEVEFLAAATVEEIAQLGIDSKGFNMDELDMSNRSHILLAVMYTAVKDEDEREGFLKKLEILMIQKGASSKERAGKWIQEALRIMEPYIYIWKGIWPDLEVWGKMLHQILVENAQLFACWRFSPFLQKFSFELGERELALKGILG